MEKLMSMLRRVFLVTVEEIEEEAEDILADFQEKVDRLQAVVERHTSRIASNEDEILRLDEHNGVLRERQYRAKVLQDKLVDFIS